MTNKIIGIDPDTKKSGVCIAQMDASGKITHTLGNYTLSELDALMRQFHKEGVTPDVYVENSWIDALQRPIPLYHSKNASEAAKIATARRVGACHEVGKQLFKMIDAIYGEGFTKPYYTNDGKRTKNPKWSQDTYRWRCLSLGLVPFSRTNQETRDALRCIYNAIDIMRIEYKRNLRRKDPLNLSNTPNVSKPSAPSEA